jgi:hypothetical protein
MLFVFYFHILDSFHSIELHSISSSFSLLDLVHDDFDDNGKNFEIDD